MLHKGGTNYMQLYMHTVVYPSIYTVIIVPVSLQESCLNVDLNHTRHPPTFLDKQYFQTSALFQRETSKSGLISHLCFHICEIILKSHPFRDNCPTAIPAMSSDEWIYSIYPIFHLRIPVSFLVSIIQVLNASIYQVILKNSEINSWQ